MPFRYLRRFCYVKSGHVCNVVRWESIAYCGWWRGVVPLDERASKAIETPPAGIRSTKLGTDRRELRRPGDDS